MSRKAGFVDWTGFVAPFAKELGISLGEEKDLVALAQYYLNSKNGERSFLTDALLNEFDRPLPFQRSHEIIAHLPISTLWTTNYDKLIEDAFRAAGKNIDIKIRDKDIGFSRRQCAAVLYKMHGDISQPDTIIICKEDYERYPRTHPVFQHTLTTALLGKSFCFLGLSLDDPNLNYTLGHLCALLENEKRVHYVVFRNVRRKGNLDDSNVLTFTESPSDHARRKLRQNLRIDDLQRYGIKTILVECFEDVIEILELLDFRITLFHHLKNRLEDIQNEITGTKHERPLLSDRELYELVDKHAPAFRHKCSSCRRVVYKEPDNCPIR